MLAGHTGAMSHNVMVSHKKVWVSHGGISDQTSISYIEKINRHKVSSSVGVAYWDYES